MRSDRPARPVPRRKDAIATRERLIRAATELFATNGYLATTTLEIAAKAETAEATIYRHVAGKEALFNEAYRVAVRWGIGQFRASDIEQAPGARARLGLIARRLVEATPKDPALLTLLLRRLEGAVFDESSVMLAREFRGLLTQLMAAGKQEGSIRPGSAELWASVWLALVTYVVDRIIAREWTLDHGGVAATLEAAWDAVAYRDGRGSGPAPGAAEPLAPG
jgi:AcrR family transcriptional regulator